MAGGPAFDSVCLCHHIRGCPVLAFFARAGTMLLTQYLPPSGPVFAFLPFPNCAQNRRIHLLLMPARSKAWATPASAASKSPDVGPRKRGASAFYLEIRKLTLLVSLPPGVVTTTGPVVASAGTTAVM